jgi:segregation and condensation protein B
MEQFDDDRIEGARAGRDVEEGQRLAEGETEEGVPVTSTLADPPSLDEGGGVSSDMPPGSTASALEDASEGRASCSLDGVDAGGVTEEADGDGAEADQAPDASPPIVEEPRDTGPDMQTSASGTAGTPELPEEVVGGAAVDGTAVGNEDLETVATGGVRDDLKAIVEALIFASPEPLTPKTLFKLLDSEPKEDVVAALDALKADYARPGGLQLVEVAQGYQIVTRPELHEWVRRLFHERKTLRLSVQALETLAVIAYKQPITAPEVAEIRGVNTSGVIGTLLERRLIRIAGRKQVVGRPFLYATTREFMVRFGLKDLGDLPPMEDVSDVLGFDLPSGINEPTPRDGLLPLEEPADEPYKTEGIEAGGDEEVAADDPELTDSNVH